MKPICRVCGERPAISGARGRKRKYRICPSCRTAVRALKRETVRDRGHRGVEREIAGLLEQARISEGNLARLVELAASAPEERVREMAALALEVAAVAPELKGRPDRLRRDAPALIPRLRKYRLALWEERRVKHPERVIRRRLEDRRMAEAPPLSEAELARLESKPFGDPWGYYAGSFGDPDAPGFTDAFYWAFIRDKDDEGIPAPRAKRPKKKKPNKAAP